MSNHAAPWDNGQPLTDADEVGADDVGLDRPALDEIPHVASALRCLVEADQLLARALDILVDLELAGDDHVRDVTGVALSQWLAIVARRTSADVRMLRTAAKVCGRLPSLRAGFVEGRLSWAQVRSVALICHRLPTHVDDTVDAAIAAIIEEVSAYEPNAVVSAVRQAMASIEPAAVTKPQPEPREFLAMQPRADGHGGQVFGEMGAESWAIIDAALNAPSTQNDASKTQNGSSVRDSLLREPATDSGDHSASIDNRPDAGRRRLSRLIDLLDNASSVDDAARSGMRSRPQLLVRAELDSLLDRAHVPAALLTRLLGGKVWMDAASTRRLIDQRGADLRTVIMDSGRVVGVGRRTRVPPAWLEDAMLAVHDTCSAPGCDQPARAADIDHATPWHPQRPTDTSPGGESWADRPGRTDVDQLAPVCAHHNRHKERDGWHVTQHADHTRTWFHPRSGLATTTVPDTWRTAQGTNVVAKEQRASYTTLPKAHQPRAGPGYGPSLPTKPIWRREGDSNVIPPPPAPGLVARAIVTEPR
ncbi:MAG: DUF222 domain-containing protein [Nitriliruptoraceae bacterium]